MIGSKFKHTIFQLCIRTRGFNEHFESRNIWMHHFIEMTFYQKEINARWQIWVLKIHNYRSKKLFAYSPYAFQAFSRWVCNYRCQPKNVDFWSRAAVPFCVVKLVWCRVHYGLQPDFITNASLKDQRDAFYAPFFINHCNNRCCHSFFSRS